MPLRLETAQFALIRSYGEEAYPHECCGFLLGKVDGDLRQVATVRPATNEFDQAEKTHRFLITPRAYLHAEKAARAEGYDIIGFYHSHPDAEAKPSRYDLEHSWPWYSYVIVAVRQGRARDTTSWRLQHERRRFDREELIIAAAEPQEI